MPTAIGTSNPVIVQSNDAIRNTSTAGATDLAQSTKNNLDTSRVIPAKETGETQQTKGDGKAQQTSSELLKTSSEADSKDTKESLSSSFASKEDKVTVSENAITAKTQNRLQSERLLSLMPGII